MWKTITEKMVGIGPAVLESIAANQKKLAFYIIGGDYQRQLRNDDFFLEMSMQCVNSCQKTNFLSFE